MNNTECPEDFRPNEATIKILIAWGRVKKNPCGNKLIDEEFITREDVRLEFVDYWINKAIPSKRLKKDWQRAFQNGVKLIYWNREISEFEQKRHHRSDFGLNRMASFDEIRKPEPAKKPMKRKLTVVKSPLQIQMESGAVSN